MIIQGEHVAQHDVRPAPWRDEAPEGVAALLRELLAAGTVQRWQLLAGALELTRREAAAQALETAAAAADREPGDYYPAVPSWLRTRAELHRSGEL